MVSHSSFPPSLTSASGLPAALLTHTYPPCAHVLEMLCTFGLPYNMPVSILEESSLFFVPLGTTGSTPGVLGIPVPILPAPPLPSPVQGLPNPYVGLPDPQEGPPQEQ